MDRANGAGSGAAASRAERFEDEKRRIIESCFSKKDQDGSMIETYITHIRITEYSTHPTSPPPPQARTPDSEKPRVIIVAVRQSGRVRMHKSKENANGTFSIGKTWNLDDLSHIESYTGPQVTPNLRDWAGDTGFTVTLGKQYYWQAQTDKEKKFFIASLIKIYSKYTGGKVPELSGFDQREQDQVVGAGRRQGGAPPPRPAGTPAPQAAPGQESAPSSVTSTPSGAPRQATPDSSRLQKAPFRPPLNGANSPASSFESSFSKERTDRPPPPRWAAQNKSQDSFATSMSASARSEDTASQPPRSRNGPNVPNMPGRFGDPRDVPEQPPAPQGSELPPPERRRPPMDPSRPMDRDVVPQPLNSPINKKEPSKGDIAGVFWKAATAASAASAFKPRPGGAAERLRMAQQKMTEGPDGITGVVPAPPRPMSRDKRPETPEPSTPVSLAPAATPTAAPVAPAAAAGIRSNSPAPSPPPAAPLPPTPESTIPEVRVTPTPPPAPVSQPPKKEGPSEAAIKKAEEAAKEAAKEKAARKAAATNDTRYLQALGVDPTFLDGRSQEFGKWLDYFGWIPGDKMRSHNVEELKIDIDRELNKAQAGGWLARFREEDERVEAIKEGVGLAIAECEELDNLLTLYSVELSTLSDDIAYIEAQGQGLQVQTANQKLLKKELESLLETCAITGSDLAALHTAPLDNLRGLEDVEKTLIILFKAMSKIDPNMKENDLANTGDGRIDQNQATGLNSDYSQMRIVQEKKQMYMQENGLFMRRFVEFMARQFDVAYAETKRALDGALSKKADASHHNAGREVLWKYSPLMLYARDVDLDNWNRVLQIYQDKTLPIYKTEFQNVVTHWRKNAKKMTGDESEMLFTSQAEKQQEGVATAARKLTVKRSQTLARALRSPLADGSSRAAEKSGGENRTMPFEIFGAVLEDLLPLVEMEQNFIIDFFHASTLESLDFPDYVAAAPPHSRRGGDLKRHRLMEPDRELARRVTRAMEVIFAFFESEVQRLMEWVLGQFPLQGAGVLAVLEKKMSEISQSNQDYLNATLQKLHDMLESRFVKFVDEQIRAIEETKVKINKRKGVISFIRVFPTFFTAVENMIDGSDPNLNLRRMIDAEYERILKSMFDSLMVIAREDPTGGSVANSTDPEGKEALNFHILLIENMNHFLEETDSRGIDKIEEWKEKATAQYYEHMKYYLNAIMRRPLGKLLDHLENIETQIQTGKSPTAIARQPSNSQAVFAKVLSVYDAKDLRKGIDALRKRVEKHFGDADEPALSRGLVAKVMSECETFYGTVENRIGSVTTNVYGGDVPFEWPRAEVKAAFKEK
ncbi:hypothetical protein PWT90_00978 [Aphanocladium album]|nr:hypothetical protein PWT90_00978 [Aphanocladium album]